MDVPEHETLDETESAYSCGGLIIIDPADLPLEDRYDEFNYPPVILIWNYLVRVLGPCPKIFSTALNYPAKGAPDYPHRPHSDELSRTWYIREHSFGVQLEDNPVAVALGEWALEYLHCFITDRVGYSAIDLCQTLADAVRRVNQLPATFGPIHAILTPDGTWYDAGYPAIVPNNCNFADELRLAHHQALLQPYQQHWALLIQWRVINPIRTPL